MLKDNKQTSFSYYSPLYDEIIPKDHFLRVIKETIDFSYANEVLKETYCEGHGRPARTPEFMLKLLFLQRLKNLSDRGVIEESSYNLVYKFFLDLNPEEKICNPSLLSKFRRNHIGSEHKLQELLRGIILQAVERGLIKGDTLIIDATHTKSHSTKENNTAQLQRLSKNLRYAIYKRHPEVKERLPQKPDKGATFGQELAYTKKLMKALEKEDLQNWENKIKREHRKLREHMEMIAQSEDSMPKKGDGSKTAKRQEKESVVDPDAKTGYKSESNCFFGYKSHIAMTDERMISAIKVTSGEDSDGKHLPVLLEQSRANGLEVTAVLADCAYGGKEMLAYLEGENITAYIHARHLVSDEKRKKEQGMIYNKDADAMQCRGGYLSIKKRISMDRGRKRYMYWFDVNKCQECPYREGCYKPGATTRTFSIKDTSEELLKHLEYEETEEFKEKIKERYKIEAKNGEMKTNHGLEYCTYRGLFGMQIQAYLTGITVNIKRIIKLIQLSQDGNSNSLVKKCNIKWFGFKFAEIINIPAKIHPIFSSLAQTVSFLSATQISRH